MSREETKEENVMKFRYLFMIITVFIIFIMTGCGNGEESSQIGPITPTTTTTAISVSAEIKTKIDNNTIKVYWKFNEDVNAYILEYGTKKNGFSNQITLDKYTTDYKVSNLQNDTIYIFRVTSVFEDASQSVSNTIEVKTATTNQLIQNDSGPKI